MTKLVWILSSVAFAGLAPLVLSQTTHTVQQSAFNFTPQVITIDIGDTVEWMRGGGTHTVTEGPGPVPTGDEAFDEPLDAANPLVTVVFDGDLLFDFPRPGDRYDYYCIPHFQNQMKGRVNVVSPWTYLGSELPGTAGAPRLVANGTLVAGSPASIDLSSARGDAVSILFVSGFNAPVPFKGGTLVPSVSPIQFVFLTSPGGEVPIPFVTPAGLPSGASLYWQYAIQDPAAVFGVALSNAVQATVP